MTADASIVENIFAWEENGRGIVITQEKVTKVPKNEQIFSKTNNIIIITMYNQCAVTITLQYITNLPAIYRLDSFLGI